MPQRDNDRIMLGRQALGARLRTVRESAGISLADAASTAKISYSYLSDVERGRRLPTLEVLDAMASGLNSTVMSLLKDLFPWDSQTPPRSVQPLPDGRKRTAD